MRRCGTLLEYVVFEPIVDLERTAELMSKIVGHTFKKDLSGYYEEYPAYVAEIDGTKYALLGPPDPENGCRHEPDHDYEMIVESCSGENIEEMVETLVARMTAEGISCHLLK